MDKTEIMEKLSSAAAFVEGGIQDACDDSCSICLENFCDSDPSTVTGCKHEFHLQCILEWCQRSSQCPMCWQPIVLKDPASQELLEVVERERSLRVNRPRTATALFHHPIVGDFELQHLPVGASEAELEERIMQHLAAAAAMGRTRHVALRREGRRRHSGASLLPTHFLLFPSDPHEHTAASATTEEHSAAPPPPPPLPQPPPPHQLMQPPGPERDEAGPSEHQSLTESLKSKFNAASMRYRETISRSTRGWKERLFSRGSTVADQLGSDVRREINNGISTVSRMIDRLDLREAPQRPPASSSSVDTPSPALTSATDEARAG
ncbi:RING-H2 group F2A [Wolffia australiana]